MSEGFSTEHLGEALRRRRQELNVSLDVVALATGVSKSTLSRLERSLRQPDTWVVARITKWLDTPADRFLNKDDGQPVIYYPHEGTPAIVRAHLERDPNLTPKTAKALAELFDVAYRQFAKE
jgi:DNA-binding XRE family transcriptional regulator